MRNFYLVATFFFAISFKGFSTHIVGGEFELIHVQDSAYLLRLVQYFDVVNGSPGAEDPEVIAFIYRKSDNQFIRSVVMPRVRRQLVDYTNPECAIGDLITRRLDYEAFIVLDQETYGDPEGYYVVFERCCRNVTISNLVNPLATGQTFYMEFPPVTKNDQPFINSTPINFPPLRDYACQNVPFYFDYRGTDPDGDSLVYSLATPLNSSAADAIPIPSPAPHPTVTFSPGISIDNVIPGDPTLAIESSGFITITPSNLGLFVFGILVEEFRDGIKLGEVRRDFQMLVIDCGGPFLSPGIDLRDPETGEFLDENEVLTLGPDDFNGEDEKCIEFIITDPNTSVGDTETISVTARGVNFTGDVIGLLSGAFGTLTGENDSLIFDLCIPKCPLLQDEPYIIDFVASDQSCPLPLMDTLRLTIDVEPPPNDPPFWANGDGIIRDTITESEILDPLLLLGRDNDGDSLEVQMIGDDFDIADFNLSLDTVVFQAGQFDLEFSWDTDCEDRNQFTIDNDFRFFFILSDQNDSDNCGLQEPDTLTVDIHVILPPNNRPQAWSELNDNERDLEILEINYTVFDQIEFETFATDADGDSILLRLASGEELTLDELGAKMNTVSGFPDINSLFAWNIPCDIYSLEDDNIIDLHLIAEDFDRCLINDHDTLTLRVDLEPPPNEIPELTTTGANGTKVDASTLEFDLLLGESVTIGMSGFDADQSDFLSLFLAGLTDSLAQFISFEEVNGLSPIGSEFTFSTNCDILDENFGSGTFEYRVFLEDDYCVQPNQDPLTLRFNVSQEEVPLFADSIPNVFTPGRDELNQFFRLKNQVAENCRFRFKSITILDRWGRKVFEDDSQSFAWDGEDAATGVYFYNIQFSNDLNYSGWLHLLRDDNGGN